MTRTRFFLALRLLTGASPALAAISACGDRPPIETATEQGADLQFNGEARRYRHLRRSDPQPMMLVDLARPGDAFASTVSLAPARGADTALRVWDGAPMACREITGRDLTALDPAGNWSGLPRALVSPPERPAEITFGPDGALAAFAGCNRITGSWALDGVVLTLDAAGRKHRLQLALESAPLIAAANGRRRLSAVFAEPGLPPARAQDLWRGLEAGLGGVGALLHSEILL